MSSELPRPVALIESRELLGQTDRIPSVKRRASIAASLIRHSLDLSSATVLRPRQASLEELAAFHSSDYVQFLADPHTEEDSQRNDDFGIGLVRHGHLQSYDCPPLPGLLSLCLTVSGASVSAAGWLRKQHQLSLNGVAINWCGGWHHAQRDSAEGFCYVNDIVLCIHELRRTFNRVLYVDLDVHHGNGVESAFAFTNKVFTMSLHLKEAGFYPGTGDISDVGFGNGKYHTLNIPFREGVNDEMYKDVFNNCLDEVNSRFQPDAIVCQCGSDSLAGDPLGGFNLTPACLVSCIRRVLNYGKPTVLLGGGGYVSTSAAILWTAITAEVLDQSLPKDGMIPDSDPFFPEYGPAFDFEVAPGNLRNANSKEDVENMKRVVKENLSFLGKL